MVLSSTDDDDDASWSNLPSLSVVDDDDEKDDESEDAFSCGGRLDDVDETLMGTDGQQHVPCDDGNKRELMSFSDDDHDVQKIKEAHEQNLEDIEDAWEDKEEDVKK